MIQAVVVEDEPRARSYLVSLLTRTGRVEVVGEAEEAGIGLCLCQQPGIDVAFLDIHLPGPDGLTLGALLARLPDPPLVVFVTGYAGHAVDAFQVHAADYLLKPLKASRVEEAVLHLEQRLRERLTAPPGGEEGKWDRHEGHLPVRDRARDVARLLRRHEVVAALRRGRRTWIHTTDAEYPTYYPVAKIDEWLGGPPFLRAARDTVVNMKYVGEILHYGSRLYRLRLRDRTGTVVDVSRSAASVLADRLKARVCDRTD